MTPRTRRTRRTRRILGVLAAAVLCLLAFGAGPASAHAALTGTDPADGAVVKEAPESVSLTFSEGVQLSDDSIRVLDPDGRAVGKGEPHHVGGRTATAATALQPGLPDGTFTVVWKVVSEDSHPISGAFTFSVGKVSKTSVAVTGEGGGDSGAKLLYDTARYLAYGGFVLMVGGSVFAGVCGGRSPVVRRVAAGGWAMLFAATAALLLLRGPYTGTGFGLTELREVLATKPGTALLSRLLLLGGAAVVLAVLFGAYERASGRDGDSVQDPDSDSDGAAPEGKDDGDDADDPARSRDLAVGLGLGGGVVAAGIAATWAMAEHASTGIQPWLAMPVSMLHLLAVAVWLGGLASLAMTMRAGPYVDRAVVRRFSRLAFSCVLVIVATGLYQAWRGLGSWGALTDTSYGQLLLVKLGLITALVGAAWMSRRWTARIGETAAEADAASAERLAVPEHELTAAARTRGEAERTGAPGTEPDPPAGDGGGNRSGSRREAQLARQREAVAAARARRAREADPQRSGLRRSVLVEAAIAVVVLSLATALTGTQPGRAETEQAASAGQQSQSGETGPVTVEVPYDTGGPKGAGSAELTLSPGRAGDNQMHVYLTNANGELVDVPEVKVAFTLEDKDIGPLDVVPTNVETGHWAATGVQLPMAGEWKLDLTVRTSGIDQVTETEKLTINE